MYKKIADEICSEIRQQFEAAEHFKNLWMQANEELEKAKQEIAQLKVRKGAPVVHEEIMLANALVEHLGDRMTDGARFKYSFEFWKKGGRLFLDNDQLILL